MFGDIKRLLKHSTIYGLGNIATKLVGFIMIPVYTRYLTPKDYGIIELLYLTTSLVSLFLSGGIYNAMTRFYFDCSQEKDKKGIVSTALLFIIFISLLGALIGFSLAKPIAGLIFNKLEYAGFFRIIFFSMAFEIIRVIPTTYLRIMERSVLFVTVSISDLVISSFLSIYFIVFLEMGIWGVLWSGIITPALISIVLVILTIKNTGVSFSANDLAKMVRFGFPLIISGLGAFLTGSADRFFLKHFTTLAVVGLYSLGYKFGIMVSFLLITPFLQMWSVFIFTVKDKPDAREIYSRVLTYLGFVIIFCGLGMSVLIKDIIKLMADKAFFDAYRVVPLIVFGFGIRGAMYVFQVGIYLEKKTKYIAYIEGIVALINLAMNLFLIPKYGIIGAGLSLAICYSLLTVFTYFVSNRLYWIEYEFGRIIMMLGLAILLYFGSTYLEIGSIWLSIIIKTGLVMLFPLLLYPLGFYHREELSRLKEIIALAKA